MQKKLLVVFAQFRKQLTKLREITSVAARTAPLFAILWVFESPHGCRRVALVEQLIHRNFECSRQLFKRRDRWDRVPVFDTRDVTAQQAGSFLDVALREILCFP
jgi:hypothetical protein